MKRLALAGALAILATVPLWVGGTYYVNIASQILFYAIFALGVNVLAGYAGLVSLGHAGLFGIAAYAAAKIMNHGYGHVAVDAAALAVTLVAAAVFAVLALRGTGLGFVMITVALGQIVWGVAYRWISITNGDNGITISGRPSPLGMSLASPAGFYCGEQQMLAIARALMSNPRVLLMDEPSEGLAPQIVAEVMSTIRRLKAQGLSIVLVEQNAKLVFDVADDIVILNSGRVVVDESAAALKANGIDLRQHLGIY